MTHSVQFSVKPVAREFEFSYLMPNETGPDDLNSYEKMYPSQAELEDDLRRAGLPASFCVPGIHGPVDVTDEQLDVLRGAGNQDYR